MNHERYTKALGSVDFAIGDMQAQLTQADHYEGLLLLQIIEQLAKTRQLITSIYKEG